ncbi:hypothetical protein Snas_5974 [Stackebrandtia nassauensis DSM 44728]|uniref:Uncharacterized protein n=1 Tax=Stackebrandtia nassauensis (strain DSM 44728 / CIP 108903 / NRRL B-16338 / NBRC 102104 / LLR-40K-21) TaxID=446470 RepID=D3Q071_STANL|nr:hypothetical protein Snas_5974 [Stackebrandtia nassauensis DSM 44728]
MLNRTSSVWLKGVAIPSGPIDMTGTNPLEKI